MAAWHCSQLRTGPAGIAAASGARRCRTTAVPRIPSTAAARPATAQRSLWVKESPPGIVDGRGYHLENSRNARALDRSRRFPLRARSVGFLRLRKLRERAGVRAITTAELIDYEVE